jgi:HEAT repeat protein
MRQDVKADPDLARWWAQNLILELFRAYDSARIAPLGQARGPFERARDELIYLDDAAVPVLVELLPAKDGVVPVVAADVLRGIGASAIAPVAGMLEHEEWRPRRVAAEILGELPYAGADEEALEARLARTAVLDTEWIVRAQAARSLGRRGLGHTTTVPAREGLIPVLLDEDPAVGREAAAALGALGDPLAVPALLNYLERGERAVDARAQDAGRAALKAVTGKKIAGGAKEWRKFWSDHRGGLLQPGPDRPY